jgi:hypothetical protein
LIEPLLHSFLLASLQTLSVATAEVLLPTCLPFPIQLVRSAALLGTFVIAPDVCVAVAAVAARDWLWLS